ncbi:MAG: hypothetical protein U5K69_22035 [Balneolaceae bacterium]|nr:hypothetical protein [Balneolaceae bacterium]
MNSIKNRLGWITVGLVLVVTSVFLVGYLPILVPGLYFDSHTEFEQYSVHADHPLNRGVNFLLREVTMKLEVTELYTGDEDFALFMCYDLSTYARFARELDVNPDSQGFTIESLGYVFINLRKIGEIGQKYGNRHPYSLLSGSATHIIAHELTHILITEHVGLFDSREIPGWKRKGYAEYAASKYLRSQDSSYSLNEQVNGFLKGNYKEVTPVRKQYIKDKLLVEYVLDAEGFSFHELMNRPLNPDSIFMELKSWSSEYLNNP